MRFMHRGFVRTQAHHGPRLALWCLILLLNILAHIAGRRQTHEKYDCLAQHSHRKYDLLSAKGKPRRCAEMGWVPLTGTILLEVADRSI